MYNSDSFPESDRNNDLHRCDFSSLEKDTGHRRLIYRYRQCPDCEAHLFPGTLKHTCEITIYIMGLHGLAYPMELREDKIQSKNPELLLLFNENCLGWKSYFISYIDEDDDKLYYESTTRDDFIAMLQN